MRRSRGMVSIGNITETIVKKNKNPDFRLALLKKMPERLLGPAIASHIAKIHMVENKLVLVIPEDAWRKELTSRRKLLLYEARKILDHIRDVQFTP